MKSKKRKQVLAGQRIYEQGEVFSSIFMMISGSSNSVVRLSSGKLAISDTTLRGDFVGFHGVMPETQIAQPVQTPGMAH